MFLLAAAKNLTNEELVKQMQNQVITMQDKQISFLNDTISNTYTALAVVVALVGIVATGIFTWISRANSKAQQKMKEAEEKLNAATQKISEAEYIVHKADETIGKLEDYRNEVNSHKSETEKRFEELSSIIEDKMRDLKGVEDKTNNLVISNKAKLLLDTIEMNLEHIFFRTARIPKVHTSAAIQDTPLYKEFITRREDLNNINSMYKAQLEIMGLDEIDKFYKQCLELHRKTLELSEDLEEFIEIIQDPEEKHEPLEIYEQIIKPSDAALPSRE